MAAKIKIEVDAKTAQEAVKKLRGEIEKLDNSVKKTRHLGGAASAGGHPSKSGSAAKVGALAGGVAGGLAGNIIDYAASAMFKLGKAFAVANLGLTDLDARIEAMSANLDTYSNPAKAALARGATLDALDDQKRQHRVGSAAEEFAWQEAIKNASGAGVQAVERIMNAIYSAAGGDAGAQQNIQALGLTGQDFEGKNDYEAAMKLLETFASKRDDDKAVRAMQSIVGMRQFGSALKMVDVLGDVRTAKNQYQKQFNEVMTPDLVQSILDKTAQAEHLQTAGKIYQMAVPAHAIDRITQGATNELEIAHAGYKGLAGDLLQDQFNQILRYFSGMKNATTGIPLIDSTAKTVGSLANTVEAVNSMNSMLPPMGVSLEQLNNNKQQLETQKQILNTMQNVNNSINNISTAATFL